MPTKKKTPWLRLLLAATGAEVLYMSWAWFDLAHRPASTMLFEQSPFFFALWAGLFLLYVIAIHSIRHASGKGETMFILSVALVFRATVLPIQLTSPPSTIVGPLELTLQSLPFFESSMWLEKALAIGTDIGALAIAPALLKAAGLSPTWTLVYGWNPLVIKEAGAGAHLEPVGLLLLVLAIRLVQKSSDMRAALAFGASLAGSLWTATSSPLMIGTLGARVIVSFLFGASAWAYFYLSGALDLSLAMTGSVGGSLLPASVGLARTFVTRDPLYPVVLCFGVWLAVVLYRAFWKRPEPGKIPGEALLALGGFLMISPQVLPWHFIPVAYFAAFSRNPGWLVFTATAPLTYLAFQNGQWSGWSFWLGFLQYFPAYFALIFGWLGRSRRNG